MNYGNQIQAATLGAEQLGTCKREPEITSVVKQLQMSIENLQQSLRDLGSKLAPVTRAEPVPDNQKIQASPPNTALGTAIYESRLAVDEMTMRVRQQIELTEL